MKLIVALLLLLAACRKADSAPAHDAAAAADSPCRQLLFEGSRYTVCRAPRARIEVRTAGRDGRPYRSFAALEHVLRRDAGRVRFAMNAGMFDADGRAIGLLIENGRELHPINRRKGGGNFHLLPNGVFLVRDDGSAAVVPTAEFEADERIAFASQSGPMLVVNGRLHPAFEPDGRSRFVRNGVGIDPDGTPVFVISEDAVSFGKFARLFRDELKCRNALYFDGSVSSLWDPANHRMDSFAALGPMVVAFAPEEDGSRR
jgi:uncharacterized protein YigE (DUF2233 family)